MKKLLSCILSAALILALLCPITALADSSPGLRMPLLANTPTQVSLWEDWGFDSLEEFLDIMGMTEEEYYEYEIEHREWLERYKEEQREWQEWWARERALILERLGGTPGITNVMVDGEFISFSNAVPEITGGVAFVPARPFFKALGAEMEYDPLTRTITAELGDGSLELVIGSDKMIINADGEESAETIAAPFIKRNTAYIPIRAVADAFGYEVFWDKDYSSVVLIDTARLIEEIDKDFAVLNSLLDMPLRQLESGGGTIRTVLDAVITMTLFDSLDGDKTAKMGANITILSDGSNFSLTGHIDIAQLLSMIFYNDPYVYDEEDILEIEELISMLSDISAEIIYNHDEGVIYIKSPLLDQLLPDFPAGAWLSVSGVDSFMEDIGLDSILGLETGDGLGGLLGGTSAGEIIAASVEMYRYYHQIFLYSAIIDEAESFGAIFGDDKFTQNGGDYSITVTLDDLADAASDVYSSLYYYTMYDLKLNIRTSGGEITEITGSLLYREGRYYYVTQYKYEFDIMPDRIRFSVEIHEKNEQKMLIEVNLSTAGSNLPIPKAPPEGATIIDFNERDDGFDIGAITPVIYTP